MSSGGTIIPVSRIDRTLEQQQRDMVSRLESRASRSSSRSIIPADRHSQELVPYDWFSDLDRWIQDRHARWNEEMDRIRREAFTLFPFDEKYSREVMPFGQFPSIMSDMRNHMEAIQRQMNHMMQDVVGRDGDLTDFFRPIADDYWLDLSRNPYEPDERGNPVFRARFNLHGFDPEDITVNSRDNQLVVRARKDERTAHSARSKQFYRMISIPHTVEERRLTSRLTKDGILEIEAPVKPEAIDRIPIGHTRRQPELAYHSAYPRTKTRNESLSELEIKPIGKMGLTVLDDRRNGRFIHVETPIEPGYEPTDMSWRVESGQLIVTGRKRSGGQHYSNETGYVKEFSRSYRIPGRIDERQIRTNARRDRFLLEAPLAC